MEHGFHFRNFQGHLVTEAKRKTMECNNNNNDKSEQITLLANAALKLTSIFVLSLGLVSF